MTKVIVIGGGWAGCASAIAAKKAGADVILIEKTDLLVGLGNVGGIMRNNGRYTAAEENIFLGGRELFEITDNATRHKNVDFPGHNHAWLYDVTKVEPMVRKLLDEMNIKVMIRNRAIDVIMNNKSIEAIRLADNQIIKGDVFVDTTGSTGPMGNCFKYGNGCAMCILRCPTFGPRISISKRAGVEDLVGKRSDGTYGAFSGSCKLNKESLSTEIRNKLDKDGVVILKVPKEDVNLEKLKMKVCEQYALKEFAEYIILLDTGHAKLMTPFYPLEKLRKIKGLENVQYKDPYSGGVGNSIRFLSMAPRENTMKVIGIDNLFCGGEKSGLMVGHTEAIVTGTLAGHNSVRHNKGVSLLELPTSLTIGDFIAYVKKEMQTEDGMKKRYTFAGSSYFERMKLKGLYSIDDNEIRNRIQSYGLYNIYDRKIM